MRYYQSASFGAIPLKTKITFGLGVILVLGILFFFAFTFFIISLISGLVLFIFSLFQRAGKNLSQGPHSSSKRPRPFQRKPPRNDDDVIDV